MESKNEKAGRQPVTDCNCLGNAAKMREALEEFVEYSNLVCRMGMFNRDRLVSITKIARDAITIPPRNCDRPECATTRAAQEVWRKEDGGKTAYYEWLLATSKEGEAK